MDVSRGAPLSMPPPLQGVETRAPPAPTRNWRRSPLWPWGLTGRGSPTCCHCCSEMWRPPWPGGGQLHHREEGQAGQVPPPAPALGQASP